MVFIGHVDAGKSTIGGQILFLTGGVDERTIQKYERCVLSPRCHLSGCCQQSGKDYHCPCSHHGARRQHSQETNASV